MSAKPHSSARRSIHFGLQVVTTNNVTFNEDIAGSIDQDVAFSIGEITDVTFRDEYNPIEVDGSREMALDDAYRGASNMGFDATFHPTNWLSAWMAFGVIKSYSGASVSSPSTIKPQTGSSDPSQIWLVNDASQFTLGDNTFGDDASGTKWDIVVDEVDTTNDLLYITTINISTDPAVGDAILPLTANSGGSSGTGITIVGFVHTLERGTALDYFSGYGITEEAKALEYAGVWVEGYSVTYTQAGLMQCSLTGQALTLDNEQDKITTTALSTVAGNTTYNYIKNGMYQPCTAGRKVGTGVAKIFRFESEDVTNRPVKIMLSTNQDTDGSGTADGVGSLVSGDPDSDPFANGSDWVPYVWSIEMGFSNTFERGPVNNDGDADYFLKGNHENTLTMTVDVPNESATAGTAHRNVATMRTMVKKFGRINADIQFGLDNGQALLVHYRNLKLFGLPRSFENSIRMPLAFFVLEQPEMTIIDDAFRYAVTT